MKQGALIFDEQTDRYDIRFDLADYYGGLHCGETSPACGCGFKPSACLLTFQRRDSSCRKK